jgi:Fur family zinc uptake transcriptional regulator
MAQPTLLSLKHACGHNHAAALPHLVAEAEAICRQRGVRLTEQRRAVFEALVRHGHPVGAYDLIEMLRPAEGRGPAPIAIYRALDFLQQNGLIHRLELLNAFIACPHQHSSNEPVAFLICEECRHVDEATSGEIQGAIEAISRPRGFTVSRQVIELLGRCAACARQADNIAVA